MLYIYFERLYWICLLVLLTFDLSISAPIGVTPPYEAYHWSGYLVLFKWLAPVSTAGLLTKFVLLGYNLENPEILPVEATFANITMREGETTLC